MEGMMNRRDFARSAAAALAAGAGSGAAFAQAGSDPDSMVDYDAAAAIELPALAASGIAVIGANGVDTIVAPWTENGERVRRLQEAAQRGDLATRSTIIAGPLPGWTPPQVAKNYWQTGFQRPPAIWPRDERASDYRHLSTRSIGNQLVGGFQRSTDAGFELSGATLRFLAERNAFDLSILKRGTLTFGLRGCQLESGAASAPWAAKHRMRVVTPNHVDMRCMIGVWRLEDNQITLFRASTVPEAGLVHAFVPYKGYGCSLLPTGFYRYRSGTHGSAQYPQRGALRIDQEYVVLRTPNDLSYDPFQAEDMWTQGASHNLHAGGSRASYPLFSSQGCQVIPGGYQMPERNFAHGAWRTFRDVCGLTKPDGFSVAAEPEKGGTFHYMLLTGLEAALHYHGNGLPERLQTAAPRQSWRLCARAAAAALRRPQHHGPC